MEMLHPRFCPLPVPARPARERQNVPPKSRESASFRRFPIRRFDTRSFRHCRRRCPGNICQAEGSVHDLTLYKESTGTAVSPDVKIKVDSGYQGIAAYHTNSEVPFKKSKNRPLSPEEKAFNRRLAIEHVNRQIKVLRIMSDRYRNRRRRHGLRMNIICAIRNCEIRYVMG